MPAQKSSHYLLSLTVAPPRMRAGNPLRLAWNVASQTAAIASVMLSIGDESGLYMIESVPACGARRIIVSRPSTFVFTLTATFGDGVRRSRQVRASVQD